jgi:hypothetical protein
MQVVSVFFLVGVLFIPVGVLPQLSARDVWHLVSSTPIVKIGTVAVSDFTYAELLTEL